MKKLVLFLVLPFLSYGQVQIGDDIDGEFEGDRASRVSLSSDGNIIAIGAYRNDDIGNNSGQVRIYENQGDNWVQMGQDINGEAEDDFSGTFVSLSSDGSIVAIGAPENDGNGEDSGHVRVYENQGDTWVQIGQDIDGEAEDDKSGISVSLSSDGSIVAIGARFNDGNGEDSGHVRVYENQGDNWVQIGEDIDGEAENDRSGGSVSLSSNGNIIAIGASSNGGNGFISGHVRVYANQSDNWVQIGQDIDGEASEDFFGRSVSLSSDGSIIAIGAPDNDGNGQSSGHVRVYENQGDNWVQIGQNIDGEAELDDLGDSVSLSSDGSVVAIGASGNDDNGEGSGHVRVYENQGNNWVQIGQDIDGEAEGNFFGRSVSLSSEGSTVAIGAPGNGANGQSSGHVRVFDLSSLLSTQESNLTSFSLYPNPATNTLTIDLSQSEILQNVTIYNSLGQEVLSSTQFTIAISSLSKGVYIVEVETATGKSSEKLIIN